jgi:hypothetical protein
VAGARPPVAWLVVAGGDHVAGDEGSFSWDGLVSDAPWIVGRASGSATAGVPLEIAFEPDGVRQATWATQWAPVADGAAGDPVPGASGGGEPIRLLPPAEAGPWSLALTATFGPGRTATWFWQIEVRR